MWSNLAWFGKELRNGEVRLATGDVTSVRGFVDRAHLHRIQEEGYAIIQTTVATEAPG
jgi:hypothetical protein